MSNTPSLQVKVRSILNIVVKTLTNHNHKDHYHTEVASSIVLTTAVWACLENGGNYTKTLIQFQEYQVFPRVLERSRFSRRLVKLADYIPLVIDTIQKQSQSKIETDPLLVTQKNTFVVDTKPVPICDNIRIFRCRLTGNRNGVDEDWRGYCASRRVYYYGFKLSLLVNCLGVPVAYTLHPGSTSDLSALYHLDLPVNSEILADKIYNCQEVEEHLQTQNISFTPIKKRNAKSGRDYIKQLRVRLFRRPIETVLSMYSELMPRLRVVSLTGAVIKAHLSVLAFAFYQGFRLGVLEEELSY